MLTSERCKLKPELSISQFSLRTSAWTRNPIFESRRIGKDNEIWPRRLLLSQRINDSTLIARPPTFHHPGYTVWYGSPRIHDRKRGPFFSVGAKRHVEFFAVCWRQFDPISRKNAERI